MSLAPHPTIEGHYQEAGKRQEYVDSRVKVHCRIPRRFLNTLPGEDLHVYLGNGHPGNGHAVNENGAARE